MSIQLHKSDAESRDALSDLQTGLIYRNPSAHLKSVHAYFPSVARVGERELLATYSLGEAFESINLRVHRSRSIDDGLTWSHEGPISDDSQGALWSETGRVTSLGGPDVVAILQRHDRSAHPDSGLANPDSNGFVPTSFVTARSRDGGRTWPEPKVLVPPLPDSAFELCTGISVLPDGKWALATCAWPDWSGRILNGYRLLSFLSEDQGDTWPRSVDVMRSGDVPMSYWESKIIPLVDGRLLAIAWVYDHQSQADLPNAYSLSSDSGESWLPWRSTDLVGQTMTPHALADGRIVCVYRRLDVKGLWAQISWLDGDDWVNGPSKPLWGHEALKRTESFSTLVDSFHALRFGAPSICGLSDGRVFVAFWCYEDNVSVIRWFRFRVN